MSGWRTRLFADVCEVVRGISFKPSDLVASGTPRALACFRTKNVQELLDTGDLWYIPRALVKNDRQLVQNGDILISTANSQNLVGKCCYVPDLAYEATLGGFIAAARARPELVNHRFLYYWLSAPATQERLRRLARQTTNISNLPLVDLGKEWVPVPPMVDQERIVGILDEADRLREWRREADLRTRALVPALFNEMFGDLVTNPKQWPLKAMGTIAEIDSPMVDPRLEEYLDLPHVGPERIEGETGKLLPTKTAREDALVSGKFLFDENHVLYSKIRPYLRKAALPDFRGLCSADIYPLRPVPSEVNREYLWAVLLSECFTRHAAGHGDRTSIPKVNRAQLNVFRCPVPPLALQNKFKDRVGEVHGLAAEQAKCRDGVAILFKALQQRAFAGTL